MWALRGAISLQTPGHLRPAQQPGPVHLLGCSRRRSLGCFAQMSLNRHLTEVCWIQYTQVTPTCGGCPFMDVRWLGSWTPPPPCQERDASNWHPLSCIFAFLALKHVPSFEHLFLTARLLQPFFPIGPFLASTLPQHVCPPCLFPVSLESTPRGFIYSFQTVNP